MSSGNHILPLCVLNVGLELWDLVFVLMSFGLTLVQFLSPVASACNLHTPRPLQHPIKTCIQEALLMALQLQNANWKIQLLKISALKSATHVIFLSTRSYTTELAICPLIQLYYHMNQPWTLYLSSNTSNKPLNTKPCQDVSVREKAQ